MPNILFIGDIVGRPGRNCVAQHLPTLKKDYDFIIANAENSAGGFGITTAIAHELFAIGVDGLTLGNHIWDQKNFSNEIDNHAHICRPANFAENTPGKTSFILEKNEFRLGVISLQGQLFMGAKVSCPFKTADQILEPLQNQTDGILVDIHAEATSEKIALGRYLDGRVSAVIGTHTHIPTADAQVLPRGTAYLTDAGMTGPYDSVLGMDLQTVIAKFLDGMPRRFSVAENNIQLRGLSIHLDPKTGLATNCNSITLKEVL